MFILIVVFSIFWGHYSELKLKKATKSLTVVRDLNISDFSHSCETF